MLFHRTRPTSHPRLERLEVRLAPAFDVFISGFPFPGDGNVQRDGTATGATYTARGPGATVALSAVLADLKAGTCGTGAGAEPTTTPSEPSRQGDPLGVRVGCSGV